MFAKTEQQEAAALAAVRYEFMVRSKNYLEKDEKASLYPRIPQHNEMIRKVYKQNE